ncbi:unnamed protein product, partial [marine sediment metagenome]
GFDIGKQLTDGEVLACPACQSRFRVLLDAETGATGFVEASPESIPEPLHLPRGSIRALTALGMAVSCWVLIGQGRDVPGGLLSVLLTVIGYYFGFRMRVKAAGSRIYDPTAREVAPLYLPGGVIRWVLIIGFAIAAGVLHSRGRLTQLKKYLEFFVVLFGLILGYVFAKVFTRRPGSPVALAINHVKGAAVLAVAGYLTVVFLGGQ